MSDVLGSRLRGLGLTPVFDESPLVHGRGYDKRGAAAGFAFTVARRAQTDDAVRDHPTPFLALGGAIAVSAVVYWLVWTLACWLLG